MRTQLIDRETCLIYTKAVCIVNTVQQALHFDFSFERKRFGIPQTNKHANEKSSRKRHVKQCATMGTFLRAATSCYSKSRSRLRRQSNMCMCVDMFGVAYPCVLHVISCNAATFAGARDMWPSLGVIIINGRVVFGVCRSTTWFAFVIRSTLCRRRFVVLLAMNNRARNRVVCAL